MMPPRLLLPTLVLLAQACAHPSSARWAGAPREDAVAARPAVSPPAIAVAEDAQSGVCAAGEHVRDCTQWAPREPVHLMAMAVSGRSIAIGWTTAGNSWVGHSKKGPARLEILDDQLDPLHRLTIPGKAVHDMAVAAWRSGWVVATAERTTTLVRHVTADGSLSRASVRLDGSVAPHLAVSSHGEVLVVRGSASNGSLVTRAALLTSLDEPPRWDVAVIDQPLDGRFGSVVALDDGFLVAQRGTAGVEVVHLDRLGRLAPRQQQVGSNTEFPKLASCGRSATMSWADFSAEFQMRWVGLDGKGRASTESIALGQVPDYFGPSPGLCDELGSIVLLGGYTAGNGVASHLELLRVDHTGRPGELLPVLGGPRVAYDWRLDALGDELVVAWIELHGTISVARLRSPSTAARAVIVAPT